MDKEDFKCPLEDGWYANEKLVLNSILRLESKFDRTDEHIAKLEDKINTLSNDITTVKVRSGFIGAVSGGITSLLAAIYLLIKN